MIPIFSILVGVLIVAIISYLFVFSKQRPKNFPPGPPRLPLWGSYWFLLKENYRYSHLSMQSLGRKYQTDIMGFYLGNNPAITTFTNKLTKELLNKEEFNGRNGGLVVEKRNVGSQRGLFFVDGPFWKEQRRFSLRFMRDYGFDRRSQMVEDLMECEIKKMIEMFSSNAKPIDEVRDFFRQTQNSQNEILIPDVFYAPCLNAIMLILSSTRFEDRFLREIGRAALRFQRSTDATGTALGMTEWLRYIAPEQFGYNSVIKDNGFLLEFLMEVMKEHKDTFIEDHPRDFIDIFYAKQKQNIADFQHPGNFTDEQLLIVLLDYMFPSAIALGHTMSFFFGNIVNNPRVQVEIHKEIDDVVGRSRLPNLDDRKNMPYLEAALRESIRITPINPLGIPRRCMEDTMFNGYFIPKDTIVFPNVWSAHRDPVVFTNPDEFIPERFLNKDGSLMKKDLTLGFGNGQRLCAGETFARQNMFLITAGLLQNFLFTTSNNQPLDLSNVVPGINISMNDPWIVPVSR